MPRFTANDKTKLASGHPVVEQTDTLTMLFTIAEDVSIGFLNGASISNNP